MSEHNKISGVNRKMNKITIYTQTNCKASEKLKNFLITQNIKYINKDITYDVLQKREMIERSGGMSTTPQIFVGNQYVKSIDELKEIINSQDSTKEETAA